MSLRLAPKNTLELTKKQTEEYENLIEEEQTEVRACRKNPHYFLTKYAWIQNKNTAQTVKWQPWDFQSDLLDIFLQYNEIVILKARQLGISWLASAYGLWKALFSDSARVLFLSQGEEEAWDMVAKARFVGGHLPEFLRPELNHDTRSWIDWKVNNSEIKALPSTDKAGRGTDATLVVRDELAQHPYGKENFTAISPAIDSGGQLIDLSTINKLAIDNHFTERVNRALLGATKKELPSGLVLYHGGESSAALVFIGWKLRPVRQEGMTLEEWFELKIKPKYTPLQIEQEYPGALEEALSPPITSAFFDVEAVNSMLLYVMPELDGVDEINTRNGIIKIWKKPIVGRKYIVYTDPSDGAVDPFATVVMDANTYEWVAIGYGMRKADEVGVIHDELVRYYNNAYNSYEGHAQGGGIVGLTLNKLETPNQAPRRDINGNVITAKGQIMYGVFLNSTDFRNLLLSEYEGAIRKNLITIHYKDAIVEHRNFARDESGKLRAVSGHDDFVMAGAGALRLGKYLPVSTGAWSRPYRRE